jgi:hypothetical protein
MSMLAKESRRCAGGGKLGQGLRMKVQPTSGGEGRMAKFTRRRDLARVRITSAARRLLVYRGSARRPIAGF